MSGQFDFEVATIIVAVLAEGHCSLSCAAADPSSQNDAILMLIPVFVR